MWDRAATPAVCRELEVRHGSEADQYRTLSGVLLTVQQRRKHTVLEKTKHALLFSVLVLILNSDFLSIKTFYSQRAPVRFQK